MGFLFQLQTQAISLQESATLTTLIRRWKPSGLLKMEEEHEYRLLNQQKILVNQHKDINIRYRRAWANKQCQFCQSLGLRLSVVRRLANKFTRLCDKQY